MTDSVTIGGSGFRIEPLKGHDNWMPWKRRMLAILRELDLDDMVDDDQKLPTAKDEKAPTIEELKERSAWLKKDEKVRTRIELAVNDTVMIHLLGADTAYDMWNQLKTIYEPKGHIGVLATR